MQRKHAARIAVLVGAWTLLSLGACSSSEGGGPDPQDPMDAAVAADAGTVDAGARLLEVGTGVDAYASLSPGERVSLVAGAQGGGRFMGFHIWSGFRMEGYRSTDVRAQYQIKLPGPTGAVLAMQERVHAVLEPNGVGFVAYGVAPRLDDCCMAEQTAIVLQVDITDGDGVTGTASTEVMTGICQDPESAPGISLCP